MALDSATYYEMLRQQAAGMMQGLGNLGMGQQPQLLGGLGPLYTPPQEIEVKSKRNELLLLLEE